MEQKVELLKLCSADLRTTFKESLKNSTDQRQELSLLWILHRIGQPAEDTDVIDKYHDKEAKKQEQLKLMQSTGEPDKNKTEEDKKLEKKKKKEEDRELEKLK